VTPSHNPLFRLRGNVIVSKGENLVLDRNDYLAIAVDVDGEVNLVRKDGTVEVLFPVDTVEGITEIADHRTGLPLSWLFYFFKSYGALEKNRKMVLDYLDGGE
jgi:hypothetical protein